MIGLGKKNSRDLPGKFISIEYGHLQHKEIHITYEQKNQPTGLEKLQRYYFLLINFFFFHYVGKVFCFYRTQRMVKDFCDFFVVFLLLFERSSFFKGKRFLIENKTLNLTNIQKNFFSHWKRQSVTN